MADTTYLRIRIADRENPANLFNMKEFRARCAIKTRLKSRTPISTQTGTQSTTHAVCARGGCATKCSLLQGWGLIDLLLRKFNEGSPRPRVARAQKIIRLHPLLCSKHLLKRVVEAALYCAHRTSTVSPCAFCEQKGHLTTPDPPSASKKNWISSDSAISEMDSPSLTSDYLIVLHSIE